jgi:hypothetical protein
MTIEATLEQTNKLLDRIATALEASASLPAATDSAPSSVTPVSEAKRTRGRPRKVEAADTVGEQAAPAATPAVAAEPASAAEEPESDADPFGDEAPEVKIEDVRAALIACRKKTNESAARKALKDAGGVDVLTQLKPEKFAAVIAAAKKAMGE